MIMLTAFINTRHDISVACGFVLPLDIGIGISIGKVHCSGLGIENIGKSGIGQLLESIQIYIHDGL